MGDHCMPSDVIEKNCVTDVLKTGVPSQSIINQFWWISIFGIQEEQGHENFLILLGKLPLFIWLILWLFLKLIVVVIKQLNYDIGKGW